MIKNVRLGFANNSSSSHSLIFIPNPENNKFKDRYIGNKEYTWNNFIISSEQEKIYYLACMLYIELYNLPQELCQNLMKEFFNVDILIFQKEPFTDVDHESRYNFPKNFDGITYNKEFIKELTEFFKKKNVVIFGGNDNDIQFHERDNSGYKPFNFNEIKEVGSDIIARKDPIYKHWVLFNRSNGNKIRFTFDEIDEHGIHYKNYNDIKSTFPELVDIKITEYCDKECKFCYQDSSKKGKHCSIYSVEELAYQLATMEVLEVALGGGDPLLHPKILDIIYIFKKYKICVNLTTRNFDYFLNKNNIEKINELFDNCSSIAFSVLNVKDCQKVERIRTLMMQREIDHYYSPEPYISPQYVMGSTKINIFLNILRYCSKNSLRLTLLGYKNIGRGKSFKSYNYSSWLDLIKKVLMENNKEYFSVCIDTCLAKQFKKELEQENIPKFSYYVEEGVNSCYIDLIKNKIYKSSYDEAEGIELDDTIPKICNTILNQGI